MDIVKIITHNTVFGQYTIQISMDQDAQNPREWSNLGTMICFHRRYSLGDKHDINQNDFSSWREMRGYIEKHYDTALLFPLYLYDHGGISISIGSFVGKAQHAEWDSGPVGFLYISKETLREEYGVKRIGTKTIKKAVEVIKAEVKVYDDYLQGNCYAYSIIDPSGNHIDSCSGYYGTNWKENSLLDTAISQIEYDVKRRMTKHIQRLKAWIRNRVPHSYREPLIS